MESLWIKTEKELIENGKILENKLETEVCIIGGGITGITCGYLLSKARKKCCNFRKK